MILPSVLQRELGFGVRTIKLDTLLERFECTKENEHLIEGQEYGDLIPPLACSFSKASPHVLAVADEDGGLMLYNTINTGLQAVLGDFEAHTNAVFDIDWMPGESQLLTASGDQTLVLWDVALNEKVITFRGHSSSVKSVCFRTRDKSVFASGSRDGHVMLWDKRTKAKGGHGTSVGVIQHAHKSGTSKPVGKKKRMSTSQESSQSVTCVIFQDEHTLISAGSGDGSVKVWDMRKSYTNTKSEPVPKHIFAYSGNSVRSHGFSSLVLDSTGSRLFASCMDHSIYQYDCVSCPRLPVATYKGHLNSTFYVRASISPDNQYLLSGSSDNNAYIWQVSNPRASPLALNGHTGEVSVASWCPVDFSKLVTLSDDGTVRVWRTTLREAPAPPGVVVGKAELTHKEIGVTASSGARLPVLQALASPTKGTMLPRSPAKALSSAVRNCLVDMTSNSNRLVATSSKAPIRCSQSIIKWFQKPRSPNKRSDFFTSPRKLLITPSKSAAKRRPEIVQNRKEEISDNTSNALTVRSVKRKLCSDSDETATTHCKRKKISSLMSDENSRSPKRPVKSPTKTGSENRVLTALANGSCGCQGNNVETVKKPLFGGSAAAASGFHSNKTSLSKTSQPNITKCQDLDAGEKLSPTVNLPNYVYDPKPRTPVAVKDNGERSKPVDWLTNLKVKKEELDTEADCCDGNKLDDVKDKTSHLHSPSPLASGTTRVSRKKPSTPKNRTRAQVTRKSNATNESAARSSRKQSTPGGSRKQITAEKQRSSILQYFSPGAQTKPIIAKDSHAS